ncbi:MAG: hypothetical protein V4577_17545 [Bacteroidota bacterium]
MFSFIKQNSKQGKECLYKVLTSSSKFDKSFATYMKEEALEHIATYRIDSY